MEETASDYSSEVFPLKHNNDIKYAIKAYVKTQLDLMKRRAKILRNENK
jgi:hypothetical protein